MSKVGIDDVHSIVIIHGRSADAVQRYAADQLAMHFRESLSVAPTIRSDCEFDGQWPPDNNVFLVGTVDSTPLISRMVDMNQLAIGSHREGFVLRRLEHPSGAGQWVIVVAGSDSVGCLWGVRDLVHYHLTVEGDLSYDGSGQGFKQVFADRRINIPDDLSVVDWPRIQHRAFWAYARDLNIDPPNVHEYVAHNPCRWIDNMSRWKANVLIVWEGHGFLMGNFPDITEYAHRRGVKVVIGIGFYSYYSEVIAPPGLKRTPNAGTIPPGQLWASDRCLCPTDPDNQRWMARYVVDYLKRYEPDGLYFQTGEVDFRTCQCPRCKDIPIGELFVHTTEPILRAVREEFGNDFWIISGQLHRKHYYQAFPKMDERITFLWESSCFPVADGWGNDPTSRPDDGRAVLAMRPGNSGLLFRFYMAGMGQAWLDRRRWAVGQLRRWARVAFENQANILCGLFQTQLPARGEYRLPAIFSEIAWDPSRSDEHFDATAKRIAELTIADPARVHLLSDPPQQVKTSYNQVMLIKHLEGLHRPDPVEQFHGLRGEVVGDVLVSEMMGDVLMEDSDPAIYTFMVDHRPRSARLTIRGCLDDLQFQRQYTLQISLNDHEVGQFPLDNWPRGQCRDGMGFVNAMPWTVALPPEDAGLWKIRLKLHAADGWIFYDRLTLTLNYA